MRIDFIRHGACLDNAFLRGRSPAELSGLGRRQMQAAFSDIPLPERVIVSPAKRCLEPVEAYYAHRVEVETWDGFQERDFGVWDGLSYEAVNALDAQKLQAYLASPFEYDIAEAESLMVFEQRITTVFERLLEQVTRGSLNHILVVTHGGVMRILLKYILGFNYNTLFKLEIGLGSRLTLECFAMKDVDCQIVNTSDFSKEYFIKVLELVQNPQNPEESISE